jgi:hypothetical protein
LFKAMDYNVTEIAYLIAACLTDQKVAIPPARLPPSALSYPPPPSIPPLVAPIPYRAERPLNRAESKSGQIWSLGWRPSSAPRMAPLISPSDGAPHQPLGWRPSSVPRMVPRRCC